MPPIPCANYRRADTDEPSLDGRDIPEGAAGKVRTTNRFDASPNSVDQFVRGVSATTTNTYWRGLRSFFREWSGREGTPNPYATHQAPAKPSAVPKALTETECRRILDAATNHNPQIRLRNPFVLSSQ